MASSYHAFQFPAASRVRLSAEGMVWIGAWDADPEPPPPPQPPGGAGEREDGRGRGLVVACTPCWGWMPSAEFGERGTYVWCEPAAA
jgi:hypothetical protein